MRVAQYVRMSTDHQDCSIAYQVAHNASAAVEMGCEIVETFADEGISGLELEPREGLRNLIERVTDGSARFSSILVYDVSRWGRFQNPDEGAYYEFLCARAGIPVIYTSDRALNDGSLTATLLKSIKRVMAAEYSRELSGRQTASKRSLCHRGLWAGGPAPFGYVRQLVGRNGMLGPRLSYGERVIMPGFHTVLVPGDASEIETVRHIYRLCSRGRGVNAITRKLNAEGRFFRYRKYWYPGAVRCILRNEIYIGTLVHGRQRKLLGRTLKGPAAQQVRIEGFVDPLISKALFARAQRQMRARTTTSFRGDQAQLLTQLASVLARHGHLSAKIIDADADCPCSTTYKRAFGTLAEAYRRVGFVPSEHGQMLVERMLHCREVAQQHRNKLSEARLLNDLRGLLAREGRISWELVRGSSEMAAPSTYLRHFGGAARIYELLGYAPDRRQAAGIRQQDKRVRVGASRSVH
ncbi:recombinase family protein [Phenylobacterium kunshanense]|uniref:Recombinase family protein n=1 Tax=Phenylobacterium kunshanense TaxID=1445034 RepID=A0A328BUJ5_9CAUL|nr:recombinase family protein [Phenylobacterium kunshanense]RAK68718.1 recombinase family protein [Phenylobacterium kunshanense]